MQKRRQRRSLSNEFKLSKAKSDIAQNPEMLSNLRNAKSDTDEPGKNTGARSNLSKRSHSDVKSDTPEKTAKFRRSSICGSGKKKSPKADSHLSKSLRKATEYGSLRDGSEEDKSSKESKQYLRDGSRINLIDDEDSNSLAEQESIATPGSAVTAEAEPQIRRKDSTHSKLKRLSSVHITVQNSVQQSVGRVRTSFRRALASSW